MFRRLTIARRLTLGFGLFLAMLVAAIVLGLSRLSALEIIVERIVSKDWQKTVLANEAMALMDANARETFLLFLPSDRTAAKARIAANVGAISRKLGALDELVYRPEGKALLAEIRTARGAYVESFSTVARLLDAGHDQEAARTMTSETVLRLAALLSSVQHLVSLQGHILEASGAEAHDAYGGARDALTVFLLLATIAAAVLARWIIRSVTRPLGGEPDDAKEVVLRIAQGDLTRDIPVNPEDRHSLLAAMRDMQLSLRQTIGELRVNSDDVAGAAHQLSSAAEQLAIGTTQQSESAATMAAAVEEMTVSIAHVSTNADEARQVTHETGTQSASGRTVIEQTVAEMEEIAQTVSQASDRIHAVGEESRKITGIVQVIKDVADQTNLLALNAAIEAARAGEQGRGFAVVADEVRKLSERTAIATNEIAAMIHAMQTSAGSAVDTMRHVVDCVESGVSMANRAGTSMSEIGDSSEQVVVAVNAISCSLKEQSVASVEISRNVERIAQMSEENSAATRETAETARRLERLAVTAHQAVSRFRI
ncbi:MAG: methyl-accepting chemotaxis protein [Burkholderiales bacterium]